MISLEAYRSQIGGYCSTARRITALSQYFRLEKQKGKRENQENCHHQSFWREILRFRNIFYFIVIMCVSVHTNYQQLLQDGDVESNPGPFHAMKVLLGSFNQGDVVRFGETAGTQCACNSLLAICWASIKRVSLWKTWDLDNVLDLGDILYKNIGGIQRSLSLEELPDNVELYGHHIQVLKLGNEYGTLSSKNPTDFIHGSMYNCEDTGNGVIFLTNGYTCAIIWAKKNYFIFDSHGHNEEGVMTGDGSSILLGFQCTDELQKYIREVYTGNIEEAQYELQYIKIETSEKVLDAISSSAKRLRECEKRQLKRKQNSCGDIAQEHAIEAKRQYQIVQERMRQYSKENRDKIVGTEKHEAQKEQQRTNSKSAFDKVKGTEKHESLKYRMRQYFKASHDKAIGTELHEISKVQKRIDSSRYENSIKGTEIHENKKRKKRENYHKANSASVTAGKRVQKFRNAVKQGPCYICVSCNRCHYLKSVVHFKEEKYNIETENIFAVINSFDGNQYICHTCHRKLLKGVVPCQAVWNNLQVYHLPMELANLRKLEKAIISRRLLFKKVAIMPKGQMPKVKGSICNVPIDTNKVYNVLPRASDSTGIIMVKLKRKLIYNGHVLFEPVRPDAIRRVLQYLLYDILLPEQYIPF